MASKTAQITYEWIADAAELPAADKQLLETARAATAQAYAPYSRFHVAAAALLHNGTIVTGTNQENASFPVGSCAERTLLGMVANLHPGIAIDAMAISYANHATGHSAVPASPCGMCRQALLEYEGRVQQPMRLLLSGQSGPVIILSRAADLLPLAFSASDLTDG